MSNMAERHQAVRIGSLCVLTYGVSYFMRHLLSVFTPALLEEGFDKSFIGTLSAIYMLAYAVGQLINGQLGDWLRPRVMVLIGLSLAGLSSLAFSLCFSAVLQAVCFVVFGFGMSMLRGPLVKMASENTKPQYAQVCCAMLSVVAFVGPLIASLLALFFRWKAAFAVSGVLALVTAMASWLILSRMEKQKSLVFVAPDRQGGICRFGNLFFLDRFVPFLLLSSLFEIAGTSIAFWTPTYLVEQLSFSNNTANLLYSVISLTKVISSFLSLYLFRLFRGDDSRMIQLLLVMATVLYISLAILPFRWINLVIFLLAQMATVVCSTTVWSIYVPSLRDTGMVSSANGVLDFAGYLAAAAANLLFANVIDVLGWQGTILLWAGIAFVGCGLATWSGRKRAANITEITKNGR